jgi:hypothetical protein
MQISNQKFHLLLNPDEWIKLLYLFPIQVPDYASITARGHSSNYKVAELQKNNFNVLARTIMPTVTEISTRHLLLMTAADLHKHLHFVNSSLVSFKASYIRITQSSNHFHPLKSTTSLADPVGSGN